MLWSTKELRTLRITSYDIISLLRLILDFQWHRFDLSPNVNRKWLGRIARMLNIHKLYQQYHMILEDGFTQIILVWVLSRTRKRRKFMSAQWYIHIGVCIYVYIRINKRIHFDDDCIASNVYFTRRCRYLHGLLSYGTYFNPNFCHRFIVYFLIFYLFFFLVFLSFKLLIVWLLLFCRRKNNIYIYIHIYCYFAKHSVRDILFSSACSELVCIKKKKQRK